MRCGASWGKKDEHRNQPDPSPDKGDVWIWRCIDVITKLRIASHISKTRDITDAVPLLAKLADRLDTLELLLTTDKLRAYRAAILDVFGVDAPPNRIGRPANRRKVFPSGLLYGQVDKERQHGRLVCVDRKAVVGTLAEIQAVLDRSGSCKVINTSFIERDNLSVRQHNGRTVRKTLSYSKDWKMHQYSIDFEDAVHNFVRVHSSLRVELPEPQGRHKWRQQTPAMAAGLTDHIWSIRELVTYNVPARL
jgi:IS1 family transposase